MKNKSRLLRDKPENYWKEKLTPEQYKILREKETEPAFSGEYDKLFKEGVYKCGACGAELFSSKTKYDAGCGWPSFYDSVDKNKIELVNDNTLGMKRVEARCTNCGSHLGHLFDDGPNPTGKRYCINSTALNFENKIEK